MQLLNLKPLLDILRQEHGTIYVVTLTPEGYARLLASPRRAKRIARRGDIRAAELPNGVAAIVTVTAVALRDLKKVLKRRKIVPESWLVLFECDQTYEEAIYVLDDGTRRIRAQTGMLDELHSYIATQAADLYSANSGIDRIQLQLREYGVDAGLKRLDERVYAE